MKWKVCCVSAGVRPVVTLIAPSHRDKTAHVLITVALGKPVVIFDQRAPHVGAVKFVMKRKVADVQ
jgi:hypothetical protein